MFYYDVLIAVATKYFLDHEVEIRIRTEVIRNQQQVIDPKKFEHDVQKELSLEDLSEENRKEIKAVKLLEQKEAAIARKHKHLLGMQDFKLPKQNSIAYNLLKKQKKNIEN